MTDIERIVVEPDAIVTALQQKYIESIPGEPVICITDDTDAELFVREDDSDRPADAVDLQPERFVGDLDLPDPDADLDDEEIEKLAERLGSEVRPELKEEVDLNAEGEGDGQLVPVEYAKDDP